MELTEKESKIVQEYIEVQAEFKGLQFKMAQLRKEADVLFEKLRTIRDKEKNLFDRIDKKNK